MAVVKIVDLLNSIKARIGDDNSDEALALIEDVSDTLSDYESRLNDSTDWKTKYEENDAEWRNKYKERFFNSGSEDDDEESHEEQPKKKTKFEELFS